MRDRDVRLAIQTALLNTGLFDAVLLTGLPETHGAAASATALAIVEPDSSTQEDLFDSAATGSLVVVSTVKLILLARNDDPQLRDQNVELLLDATANALNGQSLAGFTLPELTRLASWRWLAPQPPERKIEAVFRYHYLVDLWNSYDLSP